MRKNRFYYLIDEYRRAEARLNELQAEHIHAQTSLEIHKRLERDLETEIKKAKESKDSQLASHWQSVLDERFPKDSDWPSKATIKKAKEKISGENENLKTYYEAKVRTIRRLLGTRFTDHLDTYEEKKLLMGEGQRSAGLLAHEEAELEEQSRKRKQGFYLDKM